MAAVLGVGGTGDAMTTDLGVNSSRGLVMMGRTSTSPRRGGGGGGGGGGTYTAGGAPTPLDSSSALESSLGLPAGSVGIFSTDATSPAAGGSAAAVAAAAAAAAAAAGGMSKRRYECHICHRDFPFPSKLAEHLRTHTGEKPFACPYCSFRASLKWNLKSHIQSQHTAQQAFLGQQQ